MSNNTDLSGGRNDLFYWIAAIAFIITGVAAPIGFLMIVLKLLGGSKRGTARGRHPYYTQREGQSPVGARTSAPRQEQGGAARKKNEAWGGKFPPQDQLTQLSDKGKRLMTVGGILAAIFAAITLTAVGDAAYWLFNGEPRWFFSEVMDTIPMMCFAGAGLGCLWAGLRQRGKARRYRGYLAMVGHNKSVSVASLAAATGRPLNKVRDDLEDMLEDGLFPMGFLDYGEDRLVVSGDGVSDPPPEEKKEEPAHGEENSVLSEIKEVNDAIDNE